jgi:hypothetical protein
MRGLLINLDLPGDLENRILDEGDGVLIRVLTSAWAAILIAFRMPS